LYVPIEIASVFANPRSSHSRCCSKKIAAPEAVGVLLYLEANPDEFLFFLLHITLNQMQQYGFHDLARSRAIEPPTLNEGTQSGNFGTMHANDGVIECDDVKPCLSRPPYRGLREPHNAKLLSVQPVRPLFAGDMISYLLPVATQPIEELLQVGAGSSLYSQPATHAVVRTNLC
jgi:hypothetical protein